MFVGSNTTYNITEGELASSLATPYGAKLLAHKIQGMTVELTLSVAFRRSISATGDSTIGLWDPAPGLCCRRSSTIQARSTPWHSCQTVSSWPPHHTTKRSGSRTRLQGIRCRHSEVHSGLTYAIVFLLGGELLVSASGDYTVRLWTRPREFRCRHRGAVQI